MNDIALLELEKPAKLNKYIQVACVTYDEPSEGKVTLSGWGKTEEGKFSEVLNSVDMEILPRCLPRIFNNGMICAKAPNSFKGPCSGDSGGGLIKNIENTATVVGIVSWGVPTCGTVFGMTFPSVFTNVANYIPWIKENMYSTLRYEENSKITVK